MHESDVIKTALKGHTSVRENIHLPFEVIATFDDTGVLQQSLEIRQSTFGDKNPVF